MHSLHCPTCQKQTVKFHIAGSHISWGCSFWIRSFHKFIANLFWKLEIQESRLKTVFSYNTLTLPSCLVTKFSSRLSLRLTKLIQFSHLYLRLVCLYRSDTYNITASKCKLNRLSYPTRNKEWKWFALLCLVNISPLLSGVCTYIQRRLISRRE